MSQENINLTVLGFEISFKPGADMGRVQRAVRLMEERFADQKLRSHGGQSKDVLLTFLALGLADDLLQSKMKLDDVQNRINSLLSNIEESV